MTGAEWTLSVDFGTSYTVAATAGPEPAREVYFGARREPAMPSGVFAEADGSLLTGTMAANARQLDPDRYIGTPKRLMGGGLRTIPLPDGPVPVVRAVSAVLAGAAAEAGQRGWTRTVLTHPAGWDTGLQRMLAAAAAEAGLADVRVMAEPVAAALHLGRGCEPGEHIAVYDLGGGTFDAAVLRRTAEGFEVEATGGRNSIGGEWFDELLRRHLGSGPLGQVQAWQRLNGPGPDKETAFDAYQDWRNKVDLLHDNIRFTKEVLSEEKSWGLIIPGHPEGWTVTRGSLEDVLREPLEQTADVLTAAIADAGLGPAQLSAIYLVGGASRTPLVKKLLAERFPGKLTSHPGDPQTVVALGAAANWDRAADLDKPTPPPLTPPDPLVRWQSRLALAPAGPASSIRIDLYEVSAVPHFAIVARKQNGKQETFGAFVAAQEQREREGGWELTPPKAASFAGAALGLTQQESRTINGQTITLTRVYAAASGLLVTGWARSAEVPPAAMESLTIGFRKTGSNEQVMVGIALPAQVQQAIKERLAARARPSRVAVGFAVEALAGPLPPGAATSEEVAQHLLAEMRKAKPKIRIETADPDVFLGSRLCLHQVIAMEPENPNEITTHEYRWTGIVDGRFVRIAVRCPSRRIAERLRDLVKLR